MPHATDARRQYDQGLSTATKPGGTAAGTSQNQARRTSANYAWEYQQRKAASSSGAERATAGSGSRSAASSSSMFSRMVAREDRLERAREQSAQHRAAEQNLHPDAFRNQKSWRPTEDEHRAQMSSQIGRFAQVAAVFGGAVWLSTKLLG